MGEERYIWITRWGDFQHYTPERDRAPAWIKTYTKQLDDDRYTDLSPRRRALLHDVRAAFARTSGRLAASTSTLSRRTVSQVFRADLVALEQAGLIEVVSRETLDQRLDQLYSRSSPRARPRAREEVEVEEEPPQTPPQTRRGNSRITQKDLRRFTGCRVTRGSHGTGWKYDPLGTDQPPPDWPHERPSLDEVRGAQAART